MRLSTQPNARHTIGRFTLERLWSNLRWLGDATLDLIFPPRCLHCGRVDTWWCDVCYHDIQTMAVELTSSEVAGISGVLTTTEHTGICQDALQALKYHKQRALAPVLGERLVKALLTASWTFDMIIPVPIHMIRMQERGYNQSKLLSVAVHQHFGIELAESALIKAHKTRPQVGLGREERLENVRGAFIADDAQVRGRRVLLVDDVLTTGATLRECAETLRTYGATDVYAVTVSYAVSS